MARLVNNELERAREEVVVT